MLRQVDVSLSQDVSGLYTFAESAERLKDSIQCLKTQNPMCINFLIFSSWFWGAVYPEYFLELYSEKDEAAERGPAAEVGEEALPSNEMDQLQWLSLVMLFSCEHLWTT